MMTEEELKEIEKFYLNEDYEGDDQATEGYLRKLIDDIKLMKIEIRRLEHIIELDDKLIRAYRFGLETLHDKPELSE